MFGSILLVVGFGVGKMLVFGGGVGGAEGCFAVFASPLAFTGRTHRAVLWSEFVGVEVEMSLKPAWSGWIFLVVENFWTRTNFLFETFGQFFNLKS